MVFHRKRRSLLHPKTAQRSFFPLQSYSNKILRKNDPKNTRKYKRNVLMPPGHPIEICENVVLSKIDITVTTINKKTLKLIKAEFCVI